jgi:hypothetical protein
MAVPPQAVIDISTTSAAMPDWKNLPPAQPPSINMNGSPFAQLGEPAAPSGFQVVVLNGAGDLTSPSNIVANQYVLVRGDDGLWGTTYPAAYDQMLKTILEGANPEQQVIILASFGLDLMMSPTVGAFEFLLARGAGKDLQLWEEEATDPGSQGGGWVGAPASYLLVGNPAYGWNGGFEVFNYTNGPPAPVKLEATLQNNVPPGQGKPKAE